ncbi:hypothetical protein ASG92_21865 [Arthrobacter sp. Soil736]|uniref:DUF4192 domain-containing protein n=1 Tax=Arthrobacter sp. Soil736 TaxID=1736395 RepID=UPI0006F59DC3|nr:DUF4192 domain-containing protein [Arthrobacter sp. Soil736]KRE60307.1 hypothetical protein ASG92_21865 [Arthrobacter sp. Soil736]
MTAPQHLTITGPEDILGYVPHSLGYWPSRSLVAMTMQGKRLGATLRVDLPVSGSRREREDFARTVAGYLLADDAADGSLLMFFTNDGWTDASGPGESGQGAGRPLLADLESALGLAGMPVRDAWYVGDEYWRNAYCTDAGCCALPGRPVAEIRDSRLNAEMVFLGSSVGAPPGTALVEDDSRQAAPDPAVEAAEQRWAGELESRRTSRPQFDRVLDAWERVLAADPGADLRPEMAGFLRACLRVPPWRDAVLVMAAAGRTAAEEGAEEFGIFSARAGLPPSGPALPSPDLSGPALSRPAGQPETDAGAGRADQGTSRGRDAVPVPGYGEVLLGLSPSLPDWNTMKRLEEVMLQLSSRGPGEARAAALTAKGWIEWCRGRGSFAHASLSQALEASPGYRLAELLSEVVRRGTICGWAARREAAWQKFGTDAA